MMADKKVGSMYEDALIKTYGKEKAMKILKRDKVMFSQRELKNIKAYKGVAIGFNNRNQEE